MRLHEALLEAHRKLGLTIRPGLFDVLTEAEQRAIVGFAEAGRRHAKTDLERIDGAIRTLIDVRYDDDITRSRARKALDSLLNIKDALGDPADPDAEGELSEDPDDEKQAVADSKKADKAAKAKPKAATADGEQPGAQKATTEQPAGREVTLKIAASDDTVAEAGKGWEFTGTISAITDDTVTFSDLDDDVFEEVTLSHDDIEGFTPDGMTESILVEHPGHGSQKVHGAKNKGTWIGERAPKVGTRGRVKSKRAPQMPKDGGYAFRKKARSPYGQGYNKSGTPRKTGNWLAASEFVNEPGLIIAEATAASAQGGSTWDVLLIQPGVSKNRKRYSREVLQEAVRTGAFADARAFAPDGPDHFGHGPFGRKRGTKELVGWWTDVRYDSDVTLPDGKTAEGVVAQFHVSEAAPWLRTLLADAWSRGKPDLVGWSIVGDGDFKVVRGDDGRPLANVNKIDVVESIDPVVNPAAGGRTLRLVASKEGAVDWQALTLAEAVRGLGNGTILPDELKEHRPDLSRLVENFDGGAAAGNSGAANEVSTLVEAELGKFRVAQMLEAKLALRPRLAEPIKARIRDRIASASAKTTLAESEIEEVIKAEVDYAAAFAPAGAGSIGGIAVTEMKSSRDQMVEAAYAGLGGGEKGGDSKFSIAKFYVDVTGDTGFTGKYQENGRITESVLGEAVTSATFGEIMGDSITRRMLDFYNQPGLDDWRKIVNISPIKDFRTYRRARFGGYGNLPAVAQAAAYNPLTSPTDEEATFAITKRGGTEDLTLEAIANDDMGLVREIPRRLGRAAAQTLHEFVFDFLRTNAVIYDTLALAVAGHNNTGVAALGTAALSAGRLAMLKQAEMDNAKRLGIQPKYLIIPPDLEQLAYEITQTDREVGSANNTLNFARTFGLSVITVAYWTDVNNWWLVADPNSVPTIEIGFFNGNEQPELFVQDNPTTGSVFTNDKVTYKIRHIYGGAVLDYRGFYGAIVV